MEETISLKELMQTLRKRMSLILVITFIAVIVSAVISYFVLTPVYQTSTQILVNQKSSDQNNAYNYNEVQTNLQLINTYNVIIKSPAILDKVIDELHLDMTANQLNQKVTVSNATNSQVIDVAVEDTDANKSAKIANTIAQVFKEQVPSIMSVNNVSILTKADVGKEISPVKPKPMLNIAIALVVGLMAGVGLAFLLEYLDSTIKTEQDIERVLDLPVLGAITTIHEHDDPNSKSRIDNKKRIRGEAVGTK